MLISFINILYISSVDEDNNYLLHFILQFSY